MTEEIQKIHEFYTKEYEKLVRYAINKKGGGKSRLKLNKDDAEDLIGDILIYHLENPDKFNPKYIFNTIMQRKLNMRRDKDRLSRVIGKYKSEVIGSKDEEEEMLDPLYKLNSTNLTDEVHDMILAEDNLIKKEVLSRHLILGESVAEAVKAVEGSNRNMINRFKKAIGEEHGKG